MAVIIPCAGRSSRYPNTRPKYLLTLPNHECFFERVCNSYPDEEVHIIILREHEELYSAQTAIHKSTNAVVHMLDGPTSGPAETVYKIAKNLDTNIFIRDCDSFFTGQTPFQNSVCVVNLSENPNIRRLPEKSFAVLNEQDILVDIVEKYVCSNNICVGGYAFSSSKEFCEAFESIQSEKEVFISHLIKKMISDGVIFSAQEVFEYVDLGTYEEYLEYGKKHSTYFCDLDGTLFYNQSRLFKNDHFQTPRFIESALSFLLSKQKEGATLIFTTARPKEVSEITEEALKKGGFTNFIVLYDLPHSPRVLINDISSTNPFPSATAINVPRDSEAFWKIL